MNNKLLLEALKSGKINRKSWIDKERNVDVFDIKSDVIKTLIELGVPEKNLFVSDNTKECYHPGRSGSINLKSEKGLILLILEKYILRLLKKWILKSQIFSD